MYIKSTFKIYRDDFTYIISENLFHLSFHNGLLDESHIK